MRIQRALRDRHRAYGFFVRGSRRSLGHILACALALVGAGCEAEQEQREVPMASLEMHEDSRYYHTGERLPFTGIAVGTKDGKMISRSAFEKGNREGKLEIFWPNSGKLRSITSYEKGFRNGTRTTWDQDGVELTRETYRDDALEGSYLAWYPSGALREEGNYANGKRDGVWCLYYENTEEAQKSEETPYQLGKIHGERRTWSPGGQLIYKGHYEQGQMHGRHESWYENGARKESVFFVHGLASGLHEGWYDNGEREYRRLYKDDGKPPNEEFWTRGGVQVTGAPPPGETASKFRSSDSQVSP